MVRAENITKSFGNLEVLKGIDFEAKESEILAIVGSSGAGKSSLLQILGSLSTPTSGKAYIDGVDLYSLRPKELATFRNRKIGFVFQFHHLLPEFTAVENVAIPALIAREGMRESKRRAQELLTLLGLSERSNHKPNQLSGGEQQRVAIARALINNPSVIFADEPSGNLDSETKEEIHKLFFSLREQFGVTIIIVTHDRELADLSDITLEIKDGKFLF